MTLGELIKEYRIEHDLSQRQFAVICRLSNGYIAMLERGENPQTHQPIIPTIPRLKAVASGMGMSLNDLFLRIDEMSVDVGTPDLSPEALDIAIQFDALDARDKALIRSMLDSMKKNSAVPDLETAR